MAANTNSISIHPRTFECQDSVTRPADTTQYAVGDAISDATTTATAAGAFTLDFQTQVGGSVLLTDFTLHKSDQDQTGADIWLLLFTLELVSDTTFCYWVGGPNGGMFFKRACHETNLKF